MDDCCTHVVVPARRPRAVSVPFVGMRMVFVFLESDWPLFAADAEDRSKFVGLRNGVDALQIRASVRKGEDLSGTVGPDCLDLDALRFGELPRLAPEAEDRRVIGLKHREMQGSSRGRD